MKNLYPYTENGKCVDCGTDMESATVEFDEYGDEVIVCPNCFRAHTF